jgi:hypothetical protein
MLFSKPLGMKNQGQIKKPNINSINSIIISINSTCIQSVKGRVCICTGLEIYPFYEILQRRQTQVCISDTALQFQVHML